MNEQEETNLFHASLIIEYFMFLVTIFNLSRYFSIPQRFLTLFPFLISCIHTYANSFHRTVGYITGTIMPGPINGPIQRGTGRKVYFPSDVEGVSERFVARAITVLKHKTQSYKYLQVW